MLGASIAPNRCWGSDLSEGVAGDLMIVIWQPHHKGFGASHWRPGTYVADDARRLNCAKSLLGVRSERGRRGRPDDSYLAAASQRFRRIPLAPRHLRGRRCSAPQLRQIVAGGPNRSEEHTSELQALRHL